MNNKNWQNKLTDPTPTFTTDDPNIKLVDAGKIEVVDAGKIEALVAMEPTPVVIAEPAPVVEPTVHRAIPTIF